MAHQRHFCLYIGEKVQSTLNTELDTFWMGFMLNNSKHKYDGLSYNSASLRLPQILELCQSYVHRYAPRAPQRGFGARFAVRTENACVRNRGRQEGEISGGPQPLLV